MRLIREITNVEGRVKVDICNVRFQGMNDGAWKAG